jgi:hypothetical protein
MPFLHLLSCLVLSCLVSPCLVLSCLVLSCLVLSCLVLSSLVSSRLVSSRLVLSCLLLSQLKWWKKTISKTSTRTILWWSIARLYLTQVARAHHQSILFNLSFSARRKSDQKAHTVLLRTPPVENVPALFWSRCGESYVAQGAPRNKYSSAGVGSSYLLLSNQLLAPSKILTNGMYQSPMAPSLNRRKNVTTFTFTRPVSRPPTGVRSLVLFYILIFIALFLCKEAFSPHSTT